MRALLFLFVLCTLKLQGQPASIPESRILIPIRVNLKPIYAMVERNVDTVFTSPNYPETWVVQDCGTRYKYRFRRSPLQLQMRGTVLSLGFTGYYQIIGASRACVNGRVLSPWTPSCRCGFDEPERKVGIGFAAQFKLLPNHVLQTRIQRMEPKAFDKCTVCFWGQDVTTSVMNGLKAELDLSRKAMEDSFGTFNLRPYLQRAWNLLSTVYTIPNGGYFTLNPKKLHMENLNAQNDQLSIQFGIVASPVLSFSPPSATPLPVPDLTPSGGSGGFNVHLEAALQYDSLSHLLQGLMQGKTFELADGVFQKQITVKNASIHATPDSLLQVNISFTGSFNGQLELTGRPVYHDSTRQLVVQDLEYNLKTKNILLKTAKWLFNKKILSELNKYTVFDLTEYYGQASQTLNTWLNREWAKGIRGTGTIKKLALTGIMVQPGQLLLRSHCAGDLRVDISNVDFSF
jgi:hypothetical protein